MTREKGGVLRPAREIINLTPHQRKYLRETLGRTWDSVEVQIEASYPTGSPSDRECRTCLLRSGMEGIRILADGRCNFCHDESRLQRKSRSALALISRKQYNRAPISRCVVAFSGGQDSAKVLAYATRMLRATTTAVFFDNGFIPRQVRRNARRLTRQLGAKWVAIEEDMAAPFQRYFHTGTGMLPCQICSRRCFQAIATVCRSEDCRHVLSGHWTPALCVPLSEYTRATRDHSLTVISPLSFIRPHWDRLRNILTQADWTPMRLPGNTTNCMIQPAIELFCTSLHGYNPAVVDLSAQIRAGWITKDQAVRHLRLPRMDRRTIRRIVSRLDLPVDALVSGS